MRALIIFVAVIVMATVICLTAGATNSKTIVPKLSGFVVTTTDNGDGTLSIDITSPQCERFIVATRPGGNSIATCVPIQPAI